MSNLKLHGPNTRYEAIDPALFVGNRERLTASLLPNSLVVLHANDVMPTSGDGVMPFEQNSDFFYLCGIDQEESILVMYPDAHEARHRTMLFVKETTPEIAVWEGAKYTHAHAREAAGIREVHNLQHFHDIFDQLMKKAEHVYLNTNEHSRAKVEIEGRNIRFIKWCKERYPLHQYQRLAPLMGKLRMIKSEIEIDLIRKASEITKNAYKEIFPKVCPGMKEYEIEALFIESFTRQGSDGFAYSPIIASGKNTCVLHYTANNQICKAGDLLLLDIGAGYAHYKSDVTRVIPINGRFTKRQKSVYEAVRMIMQEAKRLLTPAHDLRSYHQQLGKVVEEALLTLGLLTSAEVKTQNPDKPAYRKYFMHGVSHHLGLDTHDLADGYAKFTPGMVLTVEPAIYIPEEKIGIRLENDVVIRKEGVDDLIADLPLTPEEIEEAMRR
jgi:Xaa-Pro aminopeptidase